MGEVALIGSDSRQGESEDWVVHSTDARAATTICEERCLRSSLSLQYQGIVFREFGREELIEPIDYWNLIHFSGVACCGPEVVVASKEHGRFCSETDEYHPGTRFYFRVSSLQEQAGYTPFMGCHTVRDRLSLDRVDHRIISSSDLRKKPWWTPRTFTDEANRMFREGFSVRPIARKG
jgi:hypothetical protein